MFKIHWCRHSESYLLFKNQTYHFLCDTIELGDKWKHMYQYWMKSLWQNFFFFSQSYVFLCLVGQSMVEAEWTQTLH